MSAFDPPRSFAQAIKALLRGEKKPQNQNRFFIESGEPWADAALEKLGAMPASAQDQWIRSLTFCATADGPRPSNKWRKQAHDEVAAIGAASFRSLILDWFPLVSLPAKAASPPIRIQGPPPEWLIDDRNATLLKGLVWCSVEFEDAEMICALSRLAQACFKKVPQLGARSPRIANACVWALSAMSAEQAAAELTRLNQVVKQPSARKLVDKTLDRVAESSGRTREEIEESGIPGYGIDADGVLKQTIGAFTAETPVVGPDAFALVWHKGGGKVQKAVPVEIKEQHAAELKSLKQMIRDVEKMLPAQGRRIERFFLAERQWDFSVWRERYLDHPLLAVLSRRLIWHFQQDDRQSAGIWRDGSLVDDQDHPITWLTPSTRVRLWHPLGQHVAKVQAWRQWLDLHQLTQPFKQAHREIYVLTDAEERTETYSNRFAAHIIRQHQFAALAQERGWKYRLQGGFDSHNVPIIELPAWGLSVEFWVDALENAPMSEVGIFLQVATDQVRFCELGGGARPLRDVPAIVFSELMRDIDLFVGVCSIGNDPAWLDQGEARDHGYWHQFAFGDLSATANTRRDVLERLLPRLKIAGQCHLQNKFLVVRGSLRAYKIHLGSSNILMEPNDQYLCIVPDRSARTDSSSDLRLPFEGDQTLALILSKAFLLAADNKIKDPTILRQIRPPSG